MVTVLGMYSFWISKTVCHFSFDIHTDNGLEKIIYLKIHQTIYLELHIFPFASNCVMAQYGSNLPLQFWYFLHDKFFALICISKCITLKCYYFDYWVGLPHLNFALRKMPHLPHSISGFDYIRKSSSVNKMCSKIQIIV